MKRLSLDNGLNWVRELNNNNINESWDKLINSMDAGTRELVHNETLGDCTREEFLVRYLELAENDLILG